MRDIKFRAWDGDGEKMLNWSLTKQFFSNCIECEHYQLEQFTGLQDSNGVDIYEGDVVYIAGYGDYVCEFPFLELYEAMPENDIGAILGNIHQNPELLD